MSEHVEHKDSTAKLFIYVALAFFLVTISLGMINAIRFVFPEFLGKISWLTYGRMRNVHTNGVLFGWLLAAQMGLVYYIVPRLSGVKLFSEKLGKYTLYLWVVILLGAVVTLFGGDNSGREYLELNTILDILVTIAWVMFAINIFGTIAKRKYTQMYTSLWYIMGAILWTALLWIVGNLPVYSGVNDANVNWWFGHNAVGLVFTPLGLAIGYYFIPKATKNPLYSHKLSLIGFWSIALLYIWTGAHHIIFGPIPVWLQTVAILFSISLLIPVWTVIANFYGTMRGKWAKGNYIIKFLLTGTTFYLLTCFQGPMHSLRSVNRIVSKTDWIPGHAHMAVFGAFTFLAIAGIYFAIPKIFKVKLYSEKLAEWHFWLSFVGFFGFAISLWIGGFIQGLQLMDHSIAFIDTVNSMAPYYVVRMFAALIMVTAQIIFVHNIIKTIKGNKASASS
ncbi:MAG: cbb3-type cytochrome c oxidase subunit I [Acidobacteriota bacterium]